MTANPASPPNNVRALRQAAGLTLAQLAARMVPPADVAGLQKVEVGKTLLNSDWIARLSKALGVPAASVLNDSPVTNWVPLIGKISAGNWEAAILNPEGQVPVVGAPPKAFALRAMGDSMDRIVPADGFVVIDPDQRDLIDGKVFAVMNGDGDTTVKRFVLNPPSLEPCSNNPEHQPIALGREPITVIGRVVWVGAAL